MLNIRAAAPKVTVESDDEKFEKEPEKGHISSDAHEAVDYESPVITADPDLDPVALDKAYHFAAWSSVALVRDLSPRFGADSDDLMPDSYLAYFDPAPALLCTYHLWRAWAHSMGRHRDNLDLLFHVYRRVVPIVGEPRCHWSDLARCN